MHFQYDENWNAFFIVLVLSLRLCFKFLFFFEYSFRTLKLLKGFNPPVKWDCVHLMGLKAIQKV